MEVFEEKVSLSSGSSEFNFLNNVVYGLTQIDSSQNLANKNQYDDMKFYALSVAGNNLVQQIECWNNILKCQSRGVRLHVPNRIFRWSLQDCKKRNKLPIVPLRHLLLDFSKYCLELQKWKVDFRELRKIVISTLERYLKNYPIFKIKAAINSAVDYVNYPQKMEQKLKQLQAIRFQPVINFSSKIKKEKLQLKYSGSVVDKNIFTCYVKNNYILAALNERNIKCQLKELELRKKIEHYNFLIDRERCAHSQTLDTYEYILQNIKQKEKILRSPANEDKIEKLRNIGYAWEHKIKAMSASLQLKMEEMEFFELEIARVKEALLLESQNVEKSPSRQTIQVKKLKKKQITDKQKSKSKSKS